MSTVATRPTPLSILVVDDEPIVVQSLGDWFRQDGHRVDTAQNSREALTLVGEKDYDLAFLDIKMPGVDGLELQSRLAAVKPEMTVIGLRRSCATPASIWPMAAKRSVSSCSLRVRAKDTPRATWPAMRVSTLRSSRS